MNATPALSSGPRPGPVPAPCRPAPAMLRILGLLAAAWLAAACGDPAPPTAAAPRSAAAPKPQDPPAAGARAAARAEAAQRPEDRMPPPRCPSTAGAGLPGPDIVGLKLGMPFDQALNHARCVVADGVFAIHPRWFQQLRTGSVTLSQQGFGIQRGETSECVYRNPGDSMKCGLGRRMWHHIDESISVASPGMDGQQAVAAIWRQQHWRPGEMPSREAVLQALRDKYGREGELRNDPHGTVSWRYDVAGMPLTRGQPEFAECGGIRARGGNHSWREGCGLSISADLVAPRDNPMLVQSLYVGMAHQENLLRIGDAMQAEIDRLEAGRRASEVQQASGTRPRL